MSDINRVWLSGTAITKPTMSSMKSRTSVCTFVLRVDENFVTPDGIPRYKQNRITIESLGKMSAQTLQRVTSGGRYMVEGYIRVSMVSGEERWSVRAFAVYRDQTGDGTQHARAIEQALKILNDSVNLNEAITALEDIRDSFQELSDGDGNT